MYFRFLHSQDERFSTDSTTSQVLCVELWLWIHSVCAHSKPTVPTIFGKPTIVGINVTPLCCISGMPKLAITHLLSAFPMPTQELGLLSCGKHAFQVGNDGKIPCHPDMIPLLPFLPLIFIGSFPSSALSPLGQL